MQTIDQPLTPKEIALIFGFSTDQAYRMRKANGGTMTISSIAKDNNCKQSEILYSL